jgi:hypothetical protein
MASAGDRHKKRARSHLPAVSGHIIDHSVERRWRYAPNITFWQNTDQLLKCQHNSTIDFTPSDAVNHDAFLETLGFLKNGG